MNDPYQIIKSRHITEKSTLLEGLQNMEANPSQARFKCPKYVFLVDPKANKHEIAQAVEAIYKSNDVKVTKVNTVLVKPKIRNKGRRRGRIGATALLKKAIVTMEAGDAIDNV